MFVIMACDDDKKHDVYFNTLKVGRFLIEDNSFKAYFYDTLVYNGKPEKDDYKWWSADLFGYYARVGVRAIKDTMIQESRIIIDQATFCMQVGGKIK